MAQQARVPKFGNWENDSTPYTQYFDNARKGKVAGKMVNPNDPQENPDAFYNHAPQSELDGSKLKDADARVPPASPLRHDAVARRLADPHTRARRASAGSDRSLEQSPLHPNYQPRSGVSRIGVNSPSRERRGSLEGHGLAPNTPERSRMGAPSGGRDDGMGEKGPSVPKFGEWDENDPASADGFTHIFNKVREEKQVGSARVPGMQPDSSSRHNRRSVGSHESTGCGCFGWLRN